MKKDKGLRRGASAQDNNRECCCTITWRISATWPNTTSLCYSILYHVRTASGNTRSSPQPLLEQLIIMFSHLNALGISLKLHGRWELWLIVTQTLKDGRCSHLAKFFITGMAAFYIILFLLPGTSHGKSCVCICLFLVNVPIYSGIFLCVSVLPYNSERLKLENLSNGVSIGK